MKKIILANVLFSMTLILVLDFAFTKSKDMSQLWPEGDTVMGFTAQPRYFGNGE